MVFRGVPDSGGNLPVIDPSGTDLVIAAHKCPTKSLVDRVKVRAKVSIDTACDGCGECRKVCPVKGAIEGEDGKRHRQPGTHRLPTAVPLTLKPYSMVLVVAE